MPVYTSLQNYPPPYCDYPEKETATMRVFLIQTAKGLCSSSGGYKANNALLRYLSSRGHRVRQLCYSYRGEVEHYMQNMNSSGEHDPRVCTTVLHMRLEDGKPGIDVKVQELCMDDGVEALALDSEAFDAVFGGKADSPNQLARMSAEYIEVIDHLSHWRPGYNIAKYHLRRRERHRRRSWTSSHSCKGKSDGFLQHTLYPTTVYP